MTADRYEGFVNTTTHTLFTKHTDAKRAGPAKVIFSLCARQKDLLAIAPTHSTDRKADTGANTGRDVC